MTKPARSAGRGSRSVPGVAGVLIVGGGYAGVHAAREVRRAGVRATIVDPSGRHDFVTRLAAVAGGTAPRSDASANLDGFADEVVIGRATQVVDGAIELDTGRRIDAEAVIVTAGSVSTRPSIPGIEHAWPLRTATDALELREEIRGAESVVVVGGGATGVQLAGAIAARHRTTAVTIVEGVDRLLSGMRRSTGRDARRILRQRGVHLRLGEPVEAINSDEVIVNDETLSGLPVWAAGFDARAASLGLPTDGTGRATVDEHLLVAGWTRTFAAGDIASHVTGNGDPLAMSAQAAVQAGATAGANAARLLAGRDLRAATLSHAGWVLDLGGNRGLAEIGPVSLSSPFLDLVPPLLHWAIDARHVIETRGLAGVLDLPGP